MTNSTRMTRNAHGGTQHQPDLWLRRGLSAERQPAIEQQAVPFDDIRSERFGVLLIVGLHCRGLPFERPVVETPQQQERAIGKGAKAECGRASSRVGAFTPVPSRKGDGSCSERRR